MSFEETMAARERELSPIVQGAIAKVRLGVLLRRPRIAETMFYGAIGIDPKHLVVWYIFARDADKRRAEADGLLADLERKTRDALRAGGYPEEAIDQMHVSFASNEEIHAGGGWSFFR